MNEKTKIIARTALLLALAIISQFFKNASVYITGPIINCILIIEVLSCGLLGGALLSVVTPLTSWLITGSAIMSALPMVPFCVMAGNFVLVLVVWLITKKSQANVPLVVGMVCGACLKAGFMTLVIANLVLGVFGPASGLPDAALNIAKTTFSVTQLITALIGSALAFVVWQSLKVFLKKPV